MKSREPTTDIFSRRGFIRLTAAAAGAWILERSVFAEALTEAQKPKAGAIIQIWLSGGLSHLDSFDPKPEAGKDFCGPLSSPIATNVAGIQISELLPELAKQADKYSLIRGMTHGSNGHETATYMVQTGHAEGDRLVYPSIGAVVSLYKGYDAGYSGVLPPYIVLTELQGRFSEVGFLGPRYKPFATGGDPAKDPFAVEGIIAEGISPERQQSRRRLLGRLDALGQVMSGDTRIEEFEMSGNTAYDMIMGDGAKIFSLTEETETVRERYGRNRFGQSCLAARRLIERGAKFVTIHSKGWDTHKQNFQTMRQKLPEVDKGVAALLMELAERGLLDSTIVWIGTEFGRTPEVQWGSPWNGGRGHHGAVFSSLVAGGGFQGGHVVGSSDKKGKELTERPVYPWDLIGSMYELLGIDPAGKFPRMGDDQVRLVQQVDGNIRSGGHLKEIM